MWRRSTAIPATMALIGATTSASVGRATTIEYTMSVVPERGAVSVAIALDDYPYETVSFGLSHVPTSAETYADRYLTVHSAADATGAPIEATSPEPVVTTYRGVDGSLRAGYEIDVRALTADLGTGSARPSLGDDFAILPLRALLMLPVEIDSRGLQFNEFAISFDFPNGWSPITPWATYDGRVSWREEWQSPVTTGIVAAGDLATVNELDAKTARMIVARDLSPDEVSVFGETLHELSEELANVFGTMGDGQWTFVVEPSDTVDIKNFGTFVRIFAPRDMLARPVGGALNEATRDYLLRLTHEMAHRWVGSFGMLRPLGGDVYWLTEGGVDYISAQVLNRAAVGAPDFFPWFVSRCVNRLRTLPNADEAIDRDATYFSNHADYRELLRAKGPISTLLIDLEIRGSSEKQSFSTMLRSLLYRVFLRGAASDMRFGPADIGEVTSSLLGLRGKFVIHANLAGDLLADLESEAASAGLSWSIGDDGGVVLGWSESGHLQRGVRERETP